MTHRTVKIGNVIIGDGNPVAIQSMTNTDTRDVEATAAQIIALENAGADIVRVSVYDEECVRTIKELKRLTHVPLVADIHYDHKLAVLSAENGIDKLRINPGNIGGAANVRRVADAARAAGIPIRVGVNSGSVPKEILKKYGSPTPLALAEGAREYAAMLEKVGFSNIVVSIKASSVTSTVAACRLFDKLSDYPQHIGVTEAGFGNAALVKSAIGIGALLLDGIGDTLRVSLTGDPCLEVTAARQILNALNLRDDFIEIVSCPTCGRTTGDLESVARHVFAQLEGASPKRHIKIAIMGCVVNGPGEAKEADIGIAFAPRGAMVFEKGLYAFSGDREATLSRFIERCKEICHDPGT